MKRAVKIAVGVLALLGLAAGGVRVFMVRDRSRDVLPELVDVPAGRRAPAQARTFLGLTIGKTTLAEARAKAAALGVQCNDSSVRALMQAKRDDTKRKMAEAEARGEDPDGVTGASLANHRSKKERNPQVRLSCEKVALTSFSADGDRARADGEPLYWLIIFDSPEHPLRHTSLSRRVDQSALAAEMDSAVAAMSKRMGAPPTTSKPLTDAAAYAEAKWEYADLKAEVTAIRVGSKARVSERVEVPWPVRVAGR